MKSIVRSTLIPGILTLTLNSAMIAQTSSQFDQWYRAKYGRPAPTEQVSAKAAQSTAAAAQPPAATLAAPGFEQWYLAKYGRPAPAEEARLQSPQATPVAVATAQPVPVVVTDTLTAKTPAEHERIAQSYREQAKSDLVQAKEHEAMVAMYKADPNINAKNQAATIGNCEYYAAKFEKLAARSQELAQLHEQKARQSR